MYYKLHQKSQPRIPGIVALMVFLLMIAGVAVLFSGKKSSQQVQPSATTIERTEIANIRDNTVTIFWRTQQPTQSYIMYGASSQEISQKIVDRRDTENQLVPRRNHMVVLSNLSSNTEYFYNLVVNDTAVGQTADIPFQFKTARYLKTPLNLDPIIGKVTYPDGKVSSETMVMIYIGSAHPLIAETKMDGSFVISPCCLFNSATYEPLYPNPSETVTVEVLDEEGKTTKLTSSLDNIDSATSVIALGRSQTQIDVTSKKEDAGVLQMAEDVDVIDPVDIIFPKQDAKIPGARPLIKGIGFPGKSVKITIQPDGRIFETTIASNKIWQFEPTFDLLPGTHTVEVVTEDEGGKALAMERIFSIEKSGEAVLGEATPEATLTPEATPTAELLPTQPLPTSAPTLFPSLPATGSSVASYGLFSILLIAVGAGMIFMF